MKNRVASGTSDYLRSVTIPTPATMATIRIRMLAFSVMDVSLM
jgi:hypothetical protein